MHAAAAELICYILFFITCILMLGHREDIKFYKSKG